jgi:hypothetical protein
MGWAKSNNSSLIENSLQINNLLLITPSSLSPIPHHHLPAGAHEAD